VLSIFIRFCVHYFVRKPLRAFILLSDYIICARPRAPLWFLRIIRTPPESNSSAFGCVPRRKLSLRLPLAKYLPKNQNAFVLTFQKSGAYLGLVKVLVLRISRIILNNPHLVSKCLHGHGTHRTILLHMPFVWGFNL
jgi:hypothetical protein